MSMHRQAAAPQLRRRASTASTCARNCWRCRPRRIVAALDRYAVVVLPRPAARPTTQQIAFSAPPRPAGNHHQGLSRGPQGAAGPHISDVSNLDENNRVLADDDRRRMNGLGNRLWHTDSSFKAIPARYSLLSARTVPATAGRPNSPTSAPPGTRCRRRCSGASRGWSRNTPFSIHAAPSASPISRRRNARACTPVPQTLVRTHPGSGRKTLYLASHAGAIRGMPLPEARLLLLDLMEHATQRQFVYTPPLAGRRPGHLGQPLHHAPGAPIRPAVPRDMHRTTVSDEHSTLEQAKQRDRAA